MLAVREQVGFISFRNHDDYGITRTWELPIVDIETSLALGYHGGYKFGRNAHYFPKLSFACVCFSVSENASPTPVVQHLPNPTRNNLIIRLYQINTDKCNHILVLLSYQYIKTTRQSKMFQPLKGPLHGIFDTF